MAGAAEQPCSRIRGNQGQAVSIMAPGASCGRPGLSCSLAYLLRNFTQRDSSGAVQFADYLRALRANINPYRESVTINGGLEPSIHELGSRGTALLKTVLSEMDKGGSRAGIPADRVRHMADQLDAMVVT